MDPNALAVVLALSGMACIALSLRPRRSPAPPDRPTAERRRAGDAGERDALRAVRGGVPGVDALGAFAFDFEDLGGPSTAQVDLLVRGKGRLLVVECKNWAGEVQASADSRTPWKVVSPSGRVWQSGSPLAQADLQSHRLSRLLGVRVDALACVLRAAPKGGRWPSNVASLEGLPRLVGGHARNPSRSGRSSVEARVEEAWEMAKCLARLDADGSVTRRHEARLAVATESWRRPAGGRPHRTGWLLTGAVLLGAAGWAAGLLH